MAYFDDSRLENPEVLQASDELLRSLAGAGARIRREAADLDLESASAFGAGQRPRGVVVLGRESRLVRAVLEPVCQVPLVAWPFDGLPAWVGALDLVVVLSPAVPPPGLEAAVAEVARRGSSLVIAAPSHSPVFDAGRSRSTLSVPLATGDETAAAIAVLALLHEMGLGPVVLPEHVAEAADMVAETCSPHRDLSVNPAKDLALQLAEAEPLVWGGTVLAARASRRIAEALRRASGRPALAADAAALTPVLNQATPADPFADPFDDQRAHQPTVLVLLDDRSGDARAVRESQELESLASHQHIRVAHLDVGDAPVGEVDRYLTLLQHGLFSAAYLRIGLGQG